MNRIRLLPEHVANQIAAGEVVERPASVVKELVENSLDAEARRVTVEIQSGGRSLIRITDDGFGMSRDDALLCLERHATSKIQCAEDLHGISTMGFRGEALPSIASVSRFSLTTRERASDSPEGTQVIINGGKIVEVKAAGSATGTCIEARSLFFNLPARRKFLRAEETEAAHIQHYLTLAALAHPEVAFTFVKDGRTIWQLSAIKNDDLPIAALRERMRQLSGTLPQLVEVDVSESLNERFNDDANNPSETPNPKLSVRLWGLIGAPGVARSTREDQHLFVNRRPVENRGINHALIEGYHTALMKGRFPVCCLFLEINPASVDVNIHPAKREVKFRDERAVRGFVTRAVRDALLGFHSAGLSRPSTAPQPLPPIEWLSVKRPTTYQEVVNREPALPGFPAPIVPSPTAQPAPLPLSFQRDTASTGKSIADVQLPAIPSSAITAPQPAHFPAHSSPTPLLSVPLRLVGVIGRLYVVLESDRGLVLLDQHAAHERILFEQMLTRLERNEITAQRLLLPETIELAPRDATFVRGVMPILTRLGVGLSEFGERTFLLDALPPMVKAPDARGFVITLIDELKATGEGVNPLRLGEHVIAKTVCRHAVKANDPLTGPELENLVNDLRHCAMPYTCPHGRPTLIEMNFRELEKKFGRAQ
jgi:DNA mismatch repair protein MutL